VALGAFLAGMVVAQSPVSHQAAADALPLRDAFAVLFFVSVGMLLDPAALLDAPWLLAGALTIVLLAKPLVAFFIVWAMRYPLRTSLMVAVALAQIGEFSFILSTIGRDLGLLSTEATNTIVAAAIVSIVINPLAFSAIRPVEQAVARRPRLRERMNRPTGTGAGLSEPAVPRVTDPKHRAVVVGFGPTGRTVVRLLQENGITPTVVDLNVDTVKRLRQDGIDAVHGDAARPETLAGAGIPDVTSLILTSAGMGSDTEVIRNAREINPRIRVLARVAYLRDLVPIRQAGADAVYAGEGEVALAFVEAILRDLGATPEQIERERARAHDELFGRP